MGNMCIKLFSILASAKGEYVSLKKNYTDLWQPFGRAKWNHLCNFGRGHYGEHVYEIILKFEPVALTGDDV